MAESELPPGSECVEGVLDLLGLLAYATLSAFFRLTDDAAAAESLSDKVALAGMAVDEHGHFLRVLRRLAELHADPETAMQPFVQAVDEFNARTTPSDWLEGLVKVYVGEGMAASFCRAVADLLDPRTQEIVNQVLAGAGQADFVVARVGQAVEADPRVAGRLVLWARRLVGEAITQAQRVVTEREPLARLLAGGDAGQLGKITRILATLADEHSHRLAALGLAGHSAAR